MKTESKPRWSFVIDTNAYAGNFEREMGGYIVGQVDEYGGHRAGSYIELYQQECPDDPFESIVEWRLYDPGDDGFMRRPASIFKSPNGDYNSVVIYLNKRPSKKLLGLLVERTIAYSKLPEMMKFFSHRPKILGCRLVQERIVVESEEVQLCPI